MANVPTGCWRIRRRLRHLSSLEARNLRDEGSNACLEGSTCFYKLWQRTPYPTEDQQAMTWFYTSEQVYGGTSPQWAEMHLGDRNDIPFASMHGPDSDHLHLHIYAAVAPIGLQHAAGYSSHSRASQAEAEPRRSTTPASGNTAKSLPEGMKALKGSQDSKATERDSISEEQLHAANKDSFPNGTTDTKWRRPDIQLTADATHSAGKLQLQDSQYHPADCKPMSNSCKLILAADVTLNGLEPLSDILDLDNRVLPSNTLILGLSDGLYIWPPSSHMRRTASGAVPAITPEPSPSPKTEEAGSSSGRWRQLPAIAEEPQAAAQPEYSSNGAAATQVAAQDLEAGLRAALDAQCSLQAQKRRRGKLLRALSKAVEVRGHAQQQREQVERLKDRARQRQGIAQRAQRSTAALRRSLALSVRVAILQAHALASACTAMLEAAGRVQGAARLLEVEGRGSRLASLQRQLVSRRCRLAASYGAVYSVGPKTVSEPEPPAGGFLWDLMDHLWFTAYVLGRQEEQHAPEEASDSLDVPSSPAPSEYGSHTSSLSRLREFSQLAIGGLELEPDLAKKILDSDTELAAAAVGYATRLTQRLAALLDVPLRYPLRFANSRSYIYSHAPPAGTIREMFESEAKNGHRGVFELLHLSDKASGAGVASLSPREFPLYYGGKELKPFQYALFLLGKDVEQVLNAHGLHSMGGAQLLQNLYKLLAAAASGAPNSSSSVRAASY